MTAAVVRGRCVLKGRVRHDSRHFGAYFNYSVVSTGSRFNV